MTTDPGPTEPDQRHRPPVAFQPEPSSSAQPPLPPSAEEDKRGEASASAAEKCAEAPAPSHGSVVDKRKRKPEDGDGSRGCSCRKSRCLKLYCVCFAAGIHCAEFCTCTPCLNKEIYGVHPNKPTSTSKISDIPESGQEIKDQLPDHIRKKCSCKKSNCLKKYCDCYQGGVGCSVNCKCDDCRNPFGRKASLFFNGRSFPLRNGTDLEYSDDEDDEDNDEDDDDIGRPVSPLPSSPVSRESSFQQHALVGVSADVHASNGNLYPKPLAQLHPDTTWHYQRRPPPPVVTEEAWSDTWRFGKLHNEDRVVTPNAADVNRSQPINEDPFSISRCIEVMNRMNELSQHEKAVAPDLFLDPRNREIFLALGVDVRTLWLRRKMKQLH